MLKYYIAAQLVALLLWRVLPWWAILLPLMLLLLHVGVLVGIFVAGAIMIGIVVRGQRKQTLSGGDNHVFRRR